MTCASEAWDVPNVVVPAIPKHRLARVDHEGIGWRREPGGARRDSPEDALDAADGPSRWGPGMADRLASDRLGEALPPSVVEGLEVQSVSVPPARIISLW